MPFTVNGIGTHYYGRSNASARRGVCEFCGRLANLTSYDTRECVCFVYIPIIPLTKYRIFDECSSCRKHRRAPFGAVQEDIRQKVDPLRQRVQSNPSDVEAREALIGTLVAFRMLREAEAAARDAVQAIPENAGLNRMAGQVLSSKGDAAGAEPFLQRAVHLDPSDAASRLSLGRVLYNQRKYADAAQQLEGARNLAPSDKTTHWLLGESYFQLQRWRDALAAFQRLAGPSIEKDLLRRIADCKKKLGYELTPAERKASRRWWPFRRQQAPKMQAAVPSSSGVKATSILALLGIIAAIAVVAVLGMGYYKGRHVDVWFDSTFPHSTFVVDAERFAADSPPQLHPLAAGAHTVELLDGKGQRIEQRKISIDALALTSAAFNDRAFVYNAGLRRVYRRARIGYSANVADSSYTEELVGGEPFFELRKIDYLFTTPPKEVDLPSGSSATTKTAFMVTNYSIVSYGLQQMSQEKYSDAEAAFRIATSADPCDLKARQFLIAAMFYHSETAAALNEAKEGIDHCPASVIEGHRLYQETLRRLGRENDAVDEYRKALASHPQSAAFHYLLARMLPNRAEGMAEEWAALRLDPSFGWAHAALGYDHLIGASYGEAMDDFNAALRTSQHDDQTLLYFTYAAIAAGRTADAHAVIDPATRPIKTEAQWWSRWLLTLADKQWISARHIYDDAARDTQPNPTVWLAGAQLFKLSADLDAYAKHVALAERRKELQPSLALLRVEDAIEHGEWQHAISNADSARQTIGESHYLTDLYAAAAAMLDGKAADGRARATAVRSAVAKDEKSAPVRKTYLALTAALLDGDEASATNGVHDDVLDLRHAYFMLGARATAAGDQAKARELFRRSAAASLNLNFPMLAAKRLAGS